MILSASLILHQFLESLGDFSGPESESKISNLTITELFYSQILNMNSLYKEFEAHTYIREGSECVTKAANDLDRKHLTVRLVLGDLDQDQ